MATEVKPTLRFPLRLEELPTPTDLAERVNRRAKQRGLSGRRRKDLEDQLKLQYYFGGQSVHYLRIDQGIVVMAAGRTGTLDYESQIAVIPQEKRANLILDFPSPWNDEQSEILTANHHES